MKYAGRIIFYVALAAGVGIWIQHRRATVLEHNRRVVADAEVAKIEDEKPQMCEDLKPLAEKVQAAIASCNYKDDWVTVTLTSYRREAFTEFLMLIGSTGYGKVDKTDRTNYFREGRDASGRQMFQHTFHLIYKLNVPK
jgi:hypothetical protein